MRSSRVIRPTRILPDAFQVVVPANVPVSSARGGVCEQESHEAREERESELRRALEDLEQRLAEERAVHEKEVIDLGTRAADSAREQVSEAVASFASMVDNIAAQRADLLKTAEEAVVRLAVAVARRIVGDAIRVDEETVLETVRRALRHVQEKERLVVRVNPEDLRIVREHRSEWLSIVEGSGSLDIEEDERIRRGGCLVETEAGNVEAQVERQVQTVEKALVERVR